MQKSEILRFLTRNPLLFILILLGSVLSLGLIFPNGNYSCIGTHCTIGINRIYVTDSLWHIALAKTGFNSFPFTNPAQSGSLLQGYNWLLDYIIFLFAKLGIPELVSFYKIVPVVVAVFLPVVIIKLGLRYNKSPLYIACLLFFGYFGSSLGPILSLYHYGTLFNSSLWQYPSSLVLQSGTIYYNLQFAASLVLVILSLCYLNRKPTLKTTLIVSLCVFFATGFKFYGGLVIVTIFTVHNMLLLIRDKKVNFLSLALPLVALLISILIFYDPLHSTATGSIFNVAPLAPSQKMIEERLLFYSEYLANARYYLYASGSFSPRLVLIEVYSVLLFFMFNFGSRVFAVGKYLLDAIRGKVLDDDYSLLMTIAVCFVFPLVFVQKGDWFNTMQLLFYGVFLSNILAAKYLYALLTKKTFPSLLLALFIVALTIPANIDQIRFWNPEQIVISEEELSALAFLQNQPKGAVLTNKEEGDLRIPAFSSQDLYVGHIQQLKITGIDFQKRLSRVAKLSQDKFCLRDVKTEFELDSFDAKYFYVDKSQVEFELIKYLVAGSKYSEIYRNQRIMIYAKN